MTFGRLELTAELDLGRLGTPRSTPVAVTWVPLYNYPLPALWAVFVMMLLAAGAYR